MMKPDLDLSAAFIRAKALARLAASEDEVPVGAVIVSNEGIVLGEGYNQREKQQNPVLHAEMSAIQMAARTLKSWRLEDTILVVTLEPCPMCLGAIQQSRISKVVYGAEDKKMGALSLGYKIHEDSRMNHRFTCDLQTDAECSQILSEFFALKREQAQKLKRKQ